MLTFWYFDIDIGTDIITEDGCCPYNDGHAAELYWKLALCFPRTSFFGDQPLCPWRRSHNPTTSPPVWKTCAPHWRSMLFWCHKCQMSKSLRPLPSRAGPLPRFPEEHPPAPRAWEWLQAELSSVSRSSAFSVQAPAITCHKGYFMHLDAESNISPGSSSQSEWQWMLPPTLPKAALDHAGGRVFSVR